MKDAVIRLYLQGTSRNDIAKTYGIGDGTVSNIIDEWKHHLGIHDAEAIRILVINLKRLGIDEAQCAAGYKILMSMKKLGVNENEFKSFILEIYEYCKRYDLTPEHIASNLKELVKLSKDVPFAKISEYIKEKKNTITKLEEDSKISKEKKESMEIEASLAEELRDEALKNEKTTVVELGEYSNLKAELKTYGLDINEDIPKFAKLVNNIRHYGFNVKEVLSEFQNLQSLIFLSGYLGNRVNQLSNQKMALEQNCSTLQYRESLHNQKLSACDELRSMGLGLNELNLLINTIMELAAEKGISYKDGVKQFFRFVEKHYDIKLRQKVQEAQQQHQHQKEYTKPDNLNPTFPSHHDFKPSTALPNQSSLVEKQRQQQLPSTSISYTYRKITNASKKTEEQNDQLNNDHDDEWYQSDDDHSL
jgi:hypothetical protein